MTHLDRTGAAIARLFLCLGVSHNILRFSYWKPGVGNIFTHFTPYGKLITGEELNAHDIAFLILPVVLLVICGALFVRDLRKPLYEGRANPIGSATLAGLVTAVVGVVLVFIGTVLFQSYGWILFCGVPVLLGFVAVWIDSQSVQQSVGRALIVSIIASVLTGLGLCLVAIEGFVCLAMAIPIAVPLAMLGGWLGYLVTRPRVKAQPAMMMLLLLFVAPNALEFEAWLGVAAPVFAVSTSTEIAAPIDEVWRATIARSELRTPQHWVFKAGIAYPRASWIIGEGMTATRYCDFSTGKLVEPVLEWRKPLPGADGVLRFTVVANPSPMQEWTPYGQIHPPHLEGFLASRQGQFRLVRIDESHTRLEATTWYQHHMAPAFYWRVWSDYIIHRVHDEVLLHIKDRAEAKD